ncbi:plastid-lipid-associated protein 6, chloroplastic [Macadamia integrifolia]|uniref:plastid-lipid-associated protein 6, chloroplastic n=1 Tax=Macadamia integrifolia TaxID=60698 RepID=UPI001C4E5554|nr:plastid-lipid-associated protein 6, chloroplastic [Macadamia integrifolia]
MGSLTHFSALLSPTPSSSLSFLHPSNNHLNLQSLKAFHPQTQLPATYPPQRWNLSKRNLIRRSTLGEAAVLEPPPPPPPTSSESKKTDPEVVASFKLKLLSAVSGLNRGLAANEEDMKKADDAAKELEAAGGPVDLSVELDKLQGRWKLIYSSAFSSRTLGGSRPGPPTGRLLPITLGQVFQRIDILSKDFDNIVELQLGTPWPIPPVEVTATLAHKFELIGPAKVKIIFEKTTVKTTGNLSQLPPFEVPRIPDSLRPPSNTGSGEFEVTYLDSDTRITRGDRSELRVFVIS